MKKIFVFFLLLVGVISYFAACDVKTETADTGSPGGIFQETIVSKNAVPGFADLHNHQMAEYAYAGAWYHGSHKGSESVALKKCTGGSIFGGDHARTIFGPVNEFLGKAPGTEGDTGWHFGKKYGYPKYSGWPRWDTIAHQQLWEGHLKQAYESGLSLYVMSAVNFRQLCEVMPKKNKEWNCDDMSTVDRQLEAAIDFAAERDWVEIAASPDEARTIINSGKLAMVLAIEVTEIFGNGDWMSQLDHYYDLGVRSIQLTHQLDNRFSGAAHHHWIFKMFQVFEDLGNGNWLDAGFDLDSNGLNINGLSTEGQELVMEMMDRKMIIDLAHLSERSINGIYDISQVYNYYPLIMSHGHFKSIMLEEKQEEEKTTSDRIVGMIKETGGIFGLRTGAEQLKTYSQSGVANDCDGSTRSFSQAYQYGVKGLKVNVAFATDMNGFIQQLRPRFGSNKEPCGASGTTSRINAQKAQQSGRLGTDFDENGFGHIGLIGDIISELKNFGVDTSGLENSSENFIQTWERCFNDSRQPLPIDDMDTGGIE
ncbi:MAG: peptidase M19 [bacterium]|nr:peptidase M19 [bacterium]